MRGVGSQLTRYCVEIEKVDLSDVQRTPSGPPFIPQNQTFSDYLSCNGGGDNHHGPGHYGPSPPPADPLAWQNYTCICDNGIDRQFAHQPAAQIQVIPTPLHVLGRISPIFPPFFPVFCAFSPSRRGGSNEPKTGIQGQETKMGAQTPF